MSNKADQINALKRFRDAYKNLLFYWDRPGSSLNDTNALIHYPFEKSFDEIDIPHWTNITINELERNIERAPELLKASDIRTILKIINEKKDDIGCISTPELNNLRRSLKSAEYVLNIKDFYQYLYTAMPDLPNETQEEQDKYDIEWEKFYCTPFTITFGHKSVTIENEATIYNGILDTLNELIENCL